MGGRKAQDGHCSGAGRAAAAAKRGCAWQPDSEDPLAEPGLSPWVPARQAEEPPRLHRGMRWALPSTSQSLAGDTAPEAAKTSACSSGHNA